MGSSPQAGKALQSGCGGTGAEFPRGLHCRGVAGRDRVADVHR